ncbi:MAG: hypothetical protein JO301_02560 [Chitinophagaceae bacterium]|nr:hypothetical protein [Chitinophagaceae bacterium]
MLKLKKLTATLIGCLILHSGISQNVNGHWYGVGMLQTSLTYQNYLSEMVLQQKGKTVAGTLHYYFRDSLVKVKLSGVFDEGSRRLRIKPFPVIYYQSPSVENSIDCFVSGDFTLVASKTESVLAGTLSGDADHRYTVPSINFRLKRSNDTLDWVKVDEPEPKQDTVALAVATPPARQEVQTMEEFGKRTKVFTKELELTGPTLRLELYDNGQIDYDSVSLIFNDKLILPKTKLDHRAIRLTVQLDESLEFNELSMFAENLGMIPPNTAALIIYDGKTRYETFLSSDFSKNASIRIRRKKG